MKHMIQSARRGSKLLAVALATAGLLGCQSAQPAGSAAGQAEGLIDVRASEALAKMCDFLAAQRSFAFSAENTMETVDASGQKLHFTRRMELEAARPDRLRARSIGDDWEKSYWYDGKQVAVLDHRAKTYSLVDAPDTIDAMLDFTAEKYGANLPISDFLYSDLNRVLTENIQAGTHVGMHSVAGARCHHLAFTQEAVDWQVWIEDGPRPLPRKLVVTYKQQASSPQFTAVFADWKTDGTFDVGNFQFAPPADAQKVDMQPVSAAQSGTAAGK